MTEKRAYTYLIAACDEKWGIGRSRTNSIPWYIPADMKFFMDTTMGNTVIMGRKTWESIGSKPIKGRLNFVVSDVCTKAQTGTGIQTNVMSGATAFSTFENALLNNNVPKSVFVIGGAGMYVEALEKWGHIVDGVYITHIKSLYDCDVLFPHDLMTSQGFTQCNVLTETDTYKRCLYSRECRDV